MVRKRKNKLILIALIILGFSAFFCFYNNSFKFYPLYTENDLDNLIDQASSASYVLLGEASHGTADYYFWRKKISQRLISEAGFSFVLVEGDWDSLYKLNLYVKHLSHPEDGAYEIMKSFNRWPTWMWANYEFLEFIDWLRDYNLNLEEDKRVGIYGMDVYGLSNSMKEIIDYFDNIDVDLASEIETLYSCLLQYEDDYSSYIHDIYQGSNNCEGSVLEVLEIIEANKEYSYEYFKIIQDSKVVFYGEKHYRTNLYQNSDSWNTRVLGMKDSLNNLINYYGEDSKAIVWAHNTHVGDARATDMRETGSINIGQLLREKYGNDQIYIVGFSSFTGTVLASLAWQEAERIFIIPKSPKNSLEYILSKNKLDSYYILLNNNVPDYLKEEIGHRAKGVVYNPLHDSYNYVKTFVNKRYDALIFINRTSHLNSIK